MQQIQELPDAGELLAAEKLPGPEATKIVTGEGISALASPRNWPDSTSSTRCERTYSRWPATPTVRSHITCGLPAEPRASQSATSSPPKPHG
jgi:hypothetical protein